MQIDQIDNLFLFAQVEQELSSPNTTLSIQPNHFDNLNNSFHPSYLIHPNNFAWVNITR
ncbi:8826_t:CDS:1, partial [Racocetra fulgida]